MIEPERGIEGNVLDEEWIVSFRELSRMCDTNGQAIRLMVTEGVLHPSGRQPDDWRFTGTDLRRALRVIRLKRDLHVNLPGAALAIELLDELEVLRQRMRTLEQQLERL